MNLGSISFILGLITMFIACQYDEKVAIDSGSVHNIFVGTVKVIK